MKFVLLLLLDVILPINHQGLGSASFYETPTINTQSPFRIILRITVRKRPVRNPQKCGIAPQWRSADRHETITIAVTKLWHNSLDL